MGVCASASAASNFPQNAHCQVMEFVEGIPLTDLASRVQGLSEAKKAAAKKRILSRVSEAYGMMILKEGLFQVRPFVFQLDEWVLGVRVWM